MMWKMSMQFTSLQNLSMGGIMMLGAHVCARVPFVMSEFFKKLLS
jgi:hypothetical protein